jgi:hypothetical protein
MTVQGSSTTRSVTEIPFMMRMTRASRLNLKRYSKAKLTIGRDFEEPSLQRDRLPSTSFPLLSD